MTYQVEWISHAHNALRSDYGLPRGLALAVASALYDKHAKAGGEMPDPLDAVSTHMRSDEEPLVNLDADYPEPHIENFA